MSNIGLQFKSYLLEKKKVSHITLKNYSSDISRFLNWYSQYFGVEFRPDNFDSKLIKLYVDEMKNGADPIARPSARSLERYISTLKRFADFMIATNLIVENPFASDENRSQQATDEWKMRGFKDFLYVNGASRATMKNYIVDINAFTTWISQSFDFSDISDPAELLTNSVLEQYKVRLKEVFNLSQASIDRKISSIRKYFKYAGRETELPVKEYQKFINTAKAEVIVPEPIATTAENTLTMDSLQLEPDPVMTSYSPIPPFRLVQKLLLPYLLLEEMISHKIALGVRRRHLETYIKAGEQLPKPDVKNTNTLLNRLKNNRPMWYKRYHNMAFTNYLHLAILIIYATILSMIMYRNMFDNKNGVQASTIAPQRVLSFQGRLTDNNDNPITSTTSVRFQIYNDASASGSALLWQEVDSVTPDNNGIFSVLLGSGSNCNGQPLTSQTTPCAIPQDLFGTHDNLYLGIAVQTTAELTPRQKIATVAYAANSESVQGMLPTTDSNAGQTNVILALDSSGNLTIGGSANPTFSASGGQFKLSGQPIVLATNPGSNGDIQLIPDGTGKIDAEAPLVNNGTSGIVTPGGVEVDDRFGVIATESSVAAFIVNNNTTGGDIFAASSSGTTRFVLQNTGDISIQPGASIDTLSIGSISIGGTNASTISLGRIGQGIRFPGFSVQNGVLYDEYGTGNLQQVTTFTPNQCLLSGPSNPYWGDCSLSGSSAFWNQVNGALSPNNSTVDFLVGGQSSASAKFSVTNVNSGTPTASISGNLIVMPNVSNSSGGNVGIGVASPTHTLELWNDDAAKSLTTTWTVTSDERTKTNIQSFNDGLAVIDQIDPVTFTYNGLGGTIAGASGIGVIAQDIQKVAPYTVGTFQAKLNPNDTNETTLLDFNPHALFFITINAIKELDAKIGALSQNVVTQAISAGQVSAQSLNVATNSITIAGVNLKDYIAEVVAEQLGTSQLVSPLASTNQVKTNVISPLADDSHISIGLDKSKVTIHATEASGSAVVASIDNSGNATFSGSLTTASASISGNLTAAGDATVAGTLYANNIQASSIEGLDDRIKSITQANDGFNNVSRQAISNYHTEIASESAGLIASINNQDGIVVGHFIDIQNLSADFGTFRQGLTALGPSTFAEASVLGTLSVGNNMTFDQNSINTYGTDLAIQPLKQGAVDFLAGAVRIETDGTLKVSGNAYFASNVTVGGNLNTNVISPLSNSKPLTITNSKPSDGETGLETDDHTLLNVQGSASVSGSLTLGKLNFPLVAPAYAVSDVEVVATGSAGMTTLKQYRTEVTIDNPIVTDHSLIYISPVGPSNDQSLFLMRQVPGKSFTVGVNSQAISDINFNWIIVN